MISAAAIENASKVFRRVFPTKTLSSVLFNYDESKKLLEESGIRETADKLKSLIDKQPTQRQVAAKEALEKWSRTKTAIERNKNFETYAKYRTISSYNE